MGRFQEVTASAIDRGNSTLRGLDAVMSLQSTRASKSAAPAGEEEKKAPFHHLRFSFSSLKPAPARVAVVSLR